MEPTNSPFQVGVEVVQHTPWGSGFGGYHGPFKVSKVYKNGYFEAPGLSGKWRPGDYLNLCVAWPVKRERFSQSRVHLYADVQAQMQLAQLASKLANVKIPIITPKTKLLKAAMLYDAITRAIKEFEG